MSQGTNEAAIAAVTEKSCYYDGMMAVRGKLGRAFHPRACIVGNEQGEMTWATLDEFVAECKEAVAQAGRPNGASTPSRSRAIPPWSVRRPVRRRVVQRRSVDGPDRRRLAHRPQDVLPTSRNLNGWRDPPPSWMVRMNVAVLRHGLKVGSQYLLTVPGRKSGAAAEHPDLGGHPRWRAVHRVGLRRGRLGQERAELRGEARWVAAGTLKPSSSSSCLNRSATRSSGHSSSRCPAACASSSHPSRTPSLPRRVATPCFASSRAEPVQLPVAGVWPATGARASR